MSRNFKLGNLRDLIPGCCT